MAGWRGGGEGQAQHVGQQGAGDDAASEGGAGGAAASGSAATAAAAPSAAGAAPGATAAARGAVLLALHGEGDQHLARYLDHLQDLVTAVGGGWGWG